MKNSLLFATSAAFSTADFFITRANLQNGGQELNPVTSMFGSSTAGLAVNFIGENVGMIGISYVFHKTGHHKLERAVSMVNIGASTDRGHVRSRSSIVVHTFLASTFKRNDCAHRFPRGRRTPRVVQPSSTRDKRRLQAGVWGS